MPRMLILSNGSLLVGIDQWLQVRDLYFPHISEENHIQGHAHQIGIFLDGRLSWLNDESWKKSVRYVKGSLVGDSSASNQELGLRVAVSDWIHPKVNIFVRRLKITNDSAFERTITLFFHQDFHLYGDGIGDCAIYYPSGKAVVHFKRQRYFLLNAQVEGEKAGSIHEFSIGRADSGETIVDALDGKLSMNAVGQGAVDSMYSVRITIPSKGTKQVHSFIVAATSLQETLDINEMVLKTGFDRLYDQTIADGNTFLKTARVPDQSDERLLDLYKRSLLLLRAHIDHRGGIIASADTDILRFNKDTYVYVWPRDGSMIARSLIRAGLAAYAKPFFRFLESAISKQGAFMHKYNPDGSLGSTWHPYVIAGKPILPVQEDETALPLLALAEYYDDTSDSDFVKDLYPTLIKPVAEFLYRFYYPDYELPMESYNLWEEHRGIHTFTCASVYAGLRAAARLGRVVKDKNAKKYDVRAEKLKEGMRRNLFDSSSGTFRTGLSFSDGGFEYNNTPDSSVLYLCLFEVFDHDELQRTIEKIHSVLKITTEVGGLARYSGDPYQKVYEGVAGNPWFIATIWHAKTLLCGKPSVQSLEEAKRIMDWIADHAYTSGVLSEQLHPTTGEPLSVAPLCWSHAEFVDLFLMYYEKMR